MPKHTQESFASPVRVKPEQSLQGREEYMRHRRLLFPEYLAPSHFVSPQVYKQLHTVQSDYLNDLDEGDKKNANYGLRTVREYFGIWIVGVRGRGKGQRHEVQIGSHVQIPVERELPVKAFRHDPRTDLWHWNCCWT